MADRRFIVPFLVQKSRGPVIPKDGAQRPTNPEGRAELS